MHDAIMHASAVRCNAAAGVVRVIFQDWAIYIDVPASHRIDNGALFQFLRDSNELRDALVTRHIGWDPRHLVFGYREGRKLTWPALDGEPPGAAVPGTYIQVVAKYGVHRLSASRN